MDEIVVIDLRRLDAGDVVTRPVIIGNGAGACKTVLINDQFISKIERAIPELALPSLISSEGFPGADALHTIYFSLTVDGKIHYGVSCFVSNEARAIAVVSRIPFITTIREHLQPVAEALISIGTLTESLSAGICNESAYWLRAQGTLHLLAETLVSLPFLTLGHSALFAGLSPRHCLKTFDAKILTFMKLLLTGGRVMIYSASPLEASSLVLSVVSLFPGLFQMGYKSTGGTVAAQRLA